MDAGVMRYNLPNRIAEVLVFRWLTGGAYRLPLLGETVSGVWRVQ